ncbi:hypothetical protein HMPREF3097_02400 [Corynebacterium sp. HMSC27B11]|nr:hypothetical protein HMPREF3097_02400 [Corynebacterium sp. HMSC27B11]
MQTRAPRPAKIRNMSNTDSFDTIAVVATSTEHGWALRELADDATDSLESLVEHLRSERAEGAVLGLVCIEDSWCAIVRPVPGGVGILMSDATAAIDDYLATDMLDELDVDTPTEEEADEADENDTAWPEGEFDMLEDLGVSEQLLTVVFDDPEYYPAEQLICVAEELGFDEELSDLLDANLPDDEDDDD